MSKNWPKKIGLVLVPNAYEGVYFDFHYSLVLAQEKPSSTTFQILAEITRNFDKILLVNPKGSKILVQSPADLQPSPRALKCIMAIL